MKKNTKSISTVGKTTLGERMFISNGKQYSLNKNQMTEIIDLLLKEIILSLKKGEKIMLPGFFSMMIVVRNPRVAMNLQTGEKMTIPSKKAVRIKVSSKLNSEKW